jgi:hypothetical protein
MDQKGFNSSTHGSGATKMDGAVSDWLQKWVKDRLKASQHPELLWQEVAETLIAGRLSLGNNPLLPVGRYAFDRQGAMEMLVARNNVGIDQEQRGDVLAAMFTYEISIGDEFFGTHPYDRLRIKYTGDGWCKDAARVCRAYLKLPDRKNGQNKERFEHHLEKLKAKMAKVAKVST